MGLSQVYGKLETPTVGDDDPVFIIRAQDMLAEAHGCQVGPVLTLEIECFRHWKAERRLPRPSAPEKPEVIGHVPRISRRL